jgi:tetratricopeptide (TPR) repeat protein|tara:strand:- start:400 stop:1170 length:771 start_codon:yes stop_codon:yes gene_type:complete
MKYLNLLFLLISFSLISQKTSIDNELYEGNEKVKKEDYLGAEMDYRLALTRAPQTPKALFNLGNTQYQANAYDEAAQQFFRTQKFSENKTEKHAALHNMGNVYMKKKEYEKAVESYKNALRNNPSDNETRYNYALAKSLLEDENKNNKDKDKQNNDKNKDKNKKGEDDKNEKSSDKDDNGKEEKEDKPNKENNEANDKNQKDSKKDNSNQNRKPGQLSPEQVKSLLEAINNQEKKVQDKINAKKVKGKPVKTKKDW